MAVEAIGHRQPALASAGVVARRVWTGALIWGGVFGLIAWVIAYNFKNEYPTPAALAKLVETMGSNVGFDALFGPSPMIDTVAGYTATHLLSVAGIAGAVWGLLAATRLLRGEEEAGRWELLLAGQTTRRRAAASAVAGLGLAFVTLWSVFAAALVAVGRMSEARFSVSASLFMATATVAGAGVFLAVGALCSQLAASRRQAAALAAAVFGFSYLLRMIAYSSTSLRWLRWATPLGWIDELRPLTGSRPLVLVPIAGTIAALVAATVVLAGRRDLGAGAIPAHDSRAPRTRLLRGPAGLAYRLVRGSAIGWTAGLAVGGFLVGLVASGTAEVWDNQSGGVIVNLAGATGAGAYLGVTFLLFAFLVAMAAAGQVTATQEDEAEGYLDNLLGRPVARLSWLAGRFAVSATALVVFGVVAGLSAWIGAAATGAGLRFTTVLAAGVNLVPAAIFVLGAGTLVHGVAPRLAGTAAYTLVAGSFLVEIIGAATGASRWLLDLSILHHIARAPGTAVRWDSAAILVALGLAAAIVGALTFGRRDLQGA